MAELTRIRMYISFVVVGEVGEVGEVVLVYDVEMDDPEEEAVEVEIKVVNPEDAATPVLVGGGVASALILRGQIVVLVSMVLVTIPTVQSSFFRSQLVIVKSFVWKKVFVEYFVFASNSEFEDGVIEGQVVFVFVFVCMTFLFSTMVFFVDDDDDDDDGKGTSQFNLSNPIVPLILTNLEARYLYPSFHPSPLNPPSTSSSQIPLAAPNSVICPSFIKAVKIPGTSNSVPFPNIPLCPGPFESRETRDVR